MNTPVGLMAHGDYFHGKPLGKFEGRRGKLCFVCGQCTITYGRHMKASHPGVKYGKKKGSRSKDCPVCANLFPFNPNVPTSFTCLLCDERCATVSDRHKHIEQHKDESGKIPSYICQKKFPTYCRVRAHFKENHRVSDFLICSVCQKTCRNKDALKRHMVSHSNDYSLACKLCDRKFKRKTNLDNHVNLFHTNKAVDKRIERKAKEKELGIVKESYKGPRERMDFEDFPYKCHGCVLGYLKRGTLIFR